MTREEAAALMGIKPPTKKMMVVTRSGNTIVRDFPADKVPGRWLREGVELKEGDVVPGTTPPGQATGRILRDATAGTMTEAANYAPMAIPGAGLAPAATRIGAGFALGAGADAGARALRGQEQSFGGSMMAGGMNAAGQTVGEALPPLVRSFARPMAKASLGGALPGMEDELLRARTPVSSEGMAADQKFIDENVRKARNTSFKTNKTFSASTLEAEIERLRNMAAKSDLLSESGETSLDEALKVMRTKLGRYYDPAAPGEVGHGKAKIRLTADQVDDMNQYAENAAKKLFEARQQNKISDPGPLEQAYLRIAKVTNGMLNTIPEVKALNAEASRRIGLKDAKFDALKRSPGKLLPLVAGEGVAQLSYAASHNPASLLAGVPAAALTYAATTPTGLSKMALGADSPLMERALRSLPRIASSAAQDVTRRHQ